MNKLTVKRVGDYYVIVKGIGKLKTCVYPTDIDEKYRNMSFPLDMNENIAKIVLPNGKKITTGFHSDYIRRYFEL